MELVFNNYGNRVTRYVGSSFVSGVRADFSVVHTGQSGQFVWTINPKTAIREIRRASNPNSHHQEPSIIKGAYGCRCV
jgi:hypothetical protein